MDKLYDILVAHHIPTWAIAIIVTIAVLARYPLAATNLILRRGKDRSMAETLLRERERLSYDQHQTVQTLNETLEKTLAMAHVALQETSAIKVELALALQRMNACETRHEICEQQLSVLSARIGQLELLQRE